MSLMKAFALGFLHHLLRRFLLDGLPQVLGDFGNKAAPIRLTAGSVGERADTHRLPTNETPLKDNDNLVLLEELDHLCFKRERQPKILVYLLVFSHGSKSWYRSLTRRVLRHIGLGVSVWYRAIRKIS